MEIVFLAASKPISKSYELDAQGQLVKHSYPFVYEVTSSLEHPTSLLDLETLIRKYARSGACMLKGVLSRPLVVESRKGSTDPDAKTDWVCLDLDGVDGFQSLDLFLDTIGCGDTSYIVQWSSSMGIENKAGFRCHVFMQLDTPQHPQLLKYWLQDLNLKHLDPQLELTKTGNALRWPLDTTTCQNDKLLYIAPPKLGKGIKNPFPKDTRIKYEARKNQTLTLPYPIPTRESLRERIDRKISDLRASTGLTKRKSTKYKYSGSTEYMANPDTATITGQRTERGFVYLNLNGGDSWAYYHPEDNPAFIYNFKGEPVYRTEDLLPEYWARVQQQSASYTPNAAGLVYLAFRDFRSSNYFNGIYNAGTQQLVISMAKSESQLRQFMKQHGQHLGDFVPDWDIVWDPHNPTIVDPSAKTVNIYQPSEFHKIEVSQLPTNPPPFPTIQKVIDHVLGHDAETVDHFHNWFACIIQFRQRAGTAWVWQGTQGTGKGVLFHQIITPLLGEQNVTAKRMEELESQFTGFMENRFAVMIDEIEAGRSLYHAKITAKLKNLIVEPTISIRNMYTTAYMAPNYTNMIFASNKSAAVEIAPDDRRFNVGPYQATPITLSATEVDELIPSELLSYFTFLIRYPADLDRARKPLINSARNSLIQVNRTAIDTLSDALLSGNLEFFWDHLSSTQNALTTRQSFKYQPYRDLVVDIIQNGTNKLSREELMIIFEWCIGGMPDSPNKFAAILKHHNILLSQIWKHGRNVRGISTKWNTDPAWLLQCQAEIAAGSV